MQAHPYPPSYGQWTGDRQPPAPANAYGSQPPPPNGAQPYAGPASYGAPGSSNGGYPSPLGQARMRTSAGGAPPPVVGQPAQMRASHAPYGEPHNVQPPPPSSYPHAPPSPPYQQQAYPVAPYTPRPFPEHPPVQLPSFGGITPGHQIVSDIDQRLAGIPSGLHPFFAFVAAIAAIGVALAFDVVFLRIHIPGVGGYAWYLTTALSFMGAGYGGARWTRAGRATIGTAIVMAGALYGVADVALGFMVESLSMHGAIILGAQGVAIALFTGFSGIYKGLRAKAYD